MFKVHGTPQFLSAIFKGDNLSDFMIVSLDKETFLILGGTDSFLHRANSVLEGRLK